MKKNIYIPLFSLFILGSCGSDKSSMSEFEGKTKRMLFLLPLKLPEEL